uniref:Uncharacterized protein n=1 Tax=Auxenochlorella protothecoides TaxID=3075 RepID=A0A1D1ZNU4_AUXPR
MDAHNAYSTALLGNSDARAELAKEVEVKMLILTSLQLLVPGASDAEYKQSAIPLFEMLGNMILDRPRRRRSLLTGGSLDLTDADSIASFLSQAQGMLSSTAATSSMRAVGWVPCSWDATRLALTLRARPCPVAGPEDSGHALAPAAAAASPRNTFTAFASITTPSCSRWPRRWRC